MLLCISCKKGSFNWFDLVFQIWLSAENCFLRFVVKTKNTSKLVPVVIEVWNALPDVKILQAFKMRKSAPQRRSRMAGGATARARGAVGRNVSTWTLHTPSCALGSGCDVRSFFAGAF